MTDFNIVLGYRCNFFCSHCANGSGPQSTKSDLRKKELNLIKATIHANAPSTILFSGGEPSLYLKEIEEILESHPKPEELCVAVVTNGSFATDAESTKKFLGAIKSLQKVRLSFDRFHKSRTSKTNIKHVIGFCADNKIEFKVTMSISNPLELASAKKLVDDLECEVEFQKVISVGRAASNALEFPHFKFDQTVLKEKCPSQGRISYLPGKGFSTCCSSLVFNGSRQNIVHKSLAEHLNSHFYQEISTRTLGEIARLRGIKIESLKAKHSMPCHLCEKIFEKVGQK